MNKTAPVVVVVAALAIIGFMTWRFAGDRILHEESTSVAPAAADGAVPGSSTNPPPMVPPSPDNRPSQPMQLDAAGIKADGIRAAEQATRKYEAIWKLDPQDPAKAAKTRQAINAAMESDFVKQARFHPQQANADCRSSMCRIESTFAAGQSDAEWSSRTLLQMGGTFGASSIVVSPGENGTSKVVIYAFRPGHGPKG